MKLTFESVVIFGCPHFFIYADGKLIDPYLIWRGNYGWFLQSDDEACYSVSHLEQIVTKLKELNS